MDWRLETGNKRDEVKLLYNNDDTFSVAALQGARLWIKRLRLLGTWDDHC